MIHTMYTYDYEPLKHLRTIPLLLPLLLDFWGGQSYLKLRDGYTAITGDISTTLVQEFKKITFFDFTTNISYFASFLLLFFG